MAESANLYEAAESLFGLPTVMTNNDPCGLRDFVQNESGWCELRRIEGRNGPLARIAPPFGPKHTVSLLGCRVNEYPSGVCAEVG
jgi:hypothetical protein